MIKLHWTDTVVPGYGNRLWVKAPWGDYDNMAQHKLLTEVTKTLDSLSMWGGCDKTYPDQRPFDMTTYIRAWEFPGRYDLKIELFQDLFTKRGFEVGTLSTEDWEF